MFAIPEAISGGATQVLDDARPRSADRRFGSSEAPTNVGLVCMGYPQRFFEPGYVWHLTARCHNRDFLLHQVLYRKLLTDTLFDNQARYRVPVLNFTVTSNHVHLLVVSSPDREAIPEMMRDLGSKVAATYNKKTDRKGGLLGTALSCDGGGER